MTFAKDKAMSIILAVVALVLCSCGRALANASPTHAILHIGGGSLIPGDEVPVVIEKEDLTIDLRGRERNRAMVNAAYLLRNTGQALTLTARFPLPEGALIGEPGVTVTCDGLPVPFKEAGSWPTLHPDVSQVADEWLDPVTGERYVPEAVSIRERYVFIEFDVGLEAGESKTLVVSYPQMLSQDYTSRFIGVPTRIDYLLQPARYWAGFGRLNVRVLTGINQFVASSLPLRHPMPGIWIGEFDGLPDENLSVFVSPSSILPDRWIGGAWLRPGGRATLLALMIALAASVIRYVVRRKAPKDGHHSRERCAGGWFAVVSAHGNPELSSAPVDERRTAHMKALLAIPLAVAKCLLVSPALYFLYFWFFVHSASILVHMLVSGLILFSLGFACGRMAGRSIRRLVFWLPGVLLTTLMVAAWQAMIWYMYHGGRGPALADVLFLFVNLVNRGLWVRRAWLVTALLLPTAGSIAGGIYTSTWRRPS